jgi:hypothetical protein
MSVLFAICAGCAAAPIAEPPVAAEAPLPVPPIPPARVPSPSPSPSVPVVVPATPGGPSPAAVLADSATTQAAADRYVAWSKSRPENINRLTVLNARVNSAIRRMKTFLRDGHYDPARVLVARQAVDALRDFLAEKGD